MSNENADGPTSAAPAQAKTAKRTRSHRRGRVKVFDNWCKGCGICIAFCPQNVFDIGPDGRPIVAREEQCTACNWCYYHCPDSAILVEVIDEDDSSQAQREKSR